MHNYKRLILCMNIITTKSSYSKAELLSNQVKSIKEISRKLGITEQTYYRWRKDYGGMRIDQAKRLKELEKEYAHSIQQTSDGGYIVAGYTDSFTYGGADFA